MEPITNKVASSGLITLDLEDFYTPGLRSELDLAPWLYEGMILREKDFRAHVKQHDWSQYQDRFCKHHMLRRCHYSTMGIHASRHRSDSFC